MNIILSGPDCCGKTTLANKLKKKYGMNILHSTSKTRNDLYYHLILLDYRDNTIFDRFHTGEIIFPQMYGRDAAITQEEFDIITRRIIDNNDLYIIFICSDPNILKARLHERGEDNNIWEVEEQLERYRDAAEYIKKFDYKNYYICDIARDFAYDYLDYWIDNHYGKVNANTAYRQLCRDLIDNGHTMETRNLRGNTKELCNYQFVITDFENPVVNLKSNHANLTYISAETLWYWSGRNDLDFISKFSTVWEKVSDDGRTSNSAYGYIMKNKYNFDQIEKIIELLKIDPYSRRAVINLNAANENIIETKDEICTICLMYTIREGKLHCTNIMRSNDCRYGTLNDIAFMITLLKYIAKRLGVEPGSYTHYANSMHVYDRDYNFIKDIADGSLEATHETIDFNLLIENKDELIDWIDNKFTSREDFTNLLKDKKIIYEY